MSMGSTTHIIDLCADDEDPSQMIIRPGWDAPHVRCSPRTFCAWPCLLRQVGTVLGSPCDCIVTGITYANPGSRQGEPMVIEEEEKLLSTQMRNLHKWYIIEAISFEIPGFWIPIKRDYFDNGTGDLWIANEELF